MPEACKCHSHNGDIGTTPGVILQHNGRDVCIDACIARVVKHLWDNDVSTAGSCCGHNGLFGIPSIILSEGEENFSRIRELIKEIDGRYFELSQWRRVLV